MSKMIYCYTIKRENIPDPRDIIIDEMQKSFMSPFGASEVVMMRHAGINASYRIWPNLEPRDAEQTATRLLTDLLNKIGSFGRFMILSIKGGVIRFEVKNCHFGHFSDTTYGQGGEKAICHFAFGIIEETYRRLTGLKIKISLVDRQAATRTCFSVATIV